MGAIAIRNGTLLLVRRLNPPEAGRWTLPGGRVNTGETLAGALEREVGEETGLTVRCGEFRGRAERISEDHHFVILDFDVTILEDRDPRPGDDATEVAWVSLENLGGIETVSGLSDFLREHGVLA